MRDELVRPARRALRQARSAASTSNEVIRGIPGSPTDHHGVPYSLTEEFVAVYRMHPLIPDDFAFRSLRRRLACSRSASCPSSARWRCATGSPRWRWPTCSTRSARSHPGAITLHNYPTLPPGLPPARTATTIDLAAIDILRRPRARRAALQRVPAALPPEAGRDVRRADGQPGLGRGARAGLRRRRARST